jgi:hydrogenase-4 membrane subunit HyfE
MLVLEWRCDMRAWSRWQDWGTILMGIVIFATPFIFEATAVTAAAWTAYIVGALLVGTGLWAASTEEPDTAIEVAPLLIGAALFVAPFVLSYTGTTAMAWMSWIIGALAFINSGLEYVVVRSQRQTAAI